MGSGSQRFRQVPSRGHGSRGAQPVPTTELGGSLRSKEAVSPGSGRLGARHQEGGAETRPRSAWSVTGDRSPAGRAPSPAGIGLQLELGRQRSPHRLEMKVKVS